jgi:hypothetical protein
MKSKKITLQHVTHKAQNLQDLEKKMRDWVRYVLGQIEMLNIPFENVANLDKMNLSFSVEGGVAIEFKRGQ